MVHTNRLTQAILANDIKTMKEVLKRDSTSNLINYYQGNETPLTLACQKGNQKLIEILLSHPDIDVNLPSKRGYYPLLLLSKHATNHKQILSYFINHSQVNLTVSQNSGKNILHDLVFNGEMGLFEEVIKKEVNFNMKQCDSLFIESFKTKNIEAVKKLYELHFSYPEIILLTYDDNRQDLLESSVYFYHKEGIDFVLSLGEDILKKEKHFSIAYATEHGDLELVKKLSTSLIGNLQNLRLAQNKASCDSFIYQYLHEQINILKEKYLLEKNTKKYLKNMSKNSTENLEILPLMENISKKKNKI